MLRLFCKRSTTFTMIPMYVVILRRLVFFLDCKEDSPKILVFYVYRTAEAVNHSKENGRKEKVVIR